MHFRHKLILSLACVLFTTSVCTGTSLYVLSSNLDTGNNQFGTIDLATGAFQQIGSDIEGSTGLAPGPNGSLLTLTFSGNLNSINSLNGITTLVGSTGLGDCSLPTSPCGPTSANTIGALGETIYAVDFANNLYRVNPLTGAAMLVGPTGIPAIPFIPLSTNPDGTFNAYDEALVGANGKLYVTFDAFTVNPATFKVGTVLIPDNLYQIDPTTGIATVVGPTDLNLAAIANANGTLYAFNDGTNQVVTLDLTNGRTSLVTNFNSPGIIVGAAPTPEPFSIALAGIGISAIVVYRMRRRAIKA
jgi:hypothetical protein